MASTTTTTTTTSSSSSSRKRRRDGAATPAAAAAPATAVPACVPRRAVPEASPGVHDLGGGARVQLWRGAVPDADAQFARLAREVAWAQREVVVFGRRVMQPRLVAFQGDATAAGGRMRYTYSGQTMVAAPFHPAALELRARVEALTGAHFNCCLFNLYRGGDDSLAWHSDNERVFGASPTIGEGSTRAGGWRVSVPHPTPATPPRSLSVAGRAPRLFAAPQRGQERGAEVFSG